MLSGDHSFAEIAGSRREGAVLPIGALEQHGHHLGLCTDTITATALARHVAETLDYYLLPALPYGTSHEHLDFAGTVTLSTATLAAIIGDVALSLRRHGFRRLIVLTGHGGNWILKPAIREINLAHPEGPMILLVDPQVWYYPLTDRPGLHHGGEYETALMLHLRPEGVHADAAQAAVVEPEMPRAILDCIPVKSVLPGGVWGSPGRANAEMGAALFKKACGHCVEYVTETFAAIDKALARNGR